MLPANQIILVISIELKAVILIDTQFEELGEFGVMGTITENCVGILLAEIIL